MAAQISPRKLMASQVPRPREAHSVRTFSSASVRELMLHTEKNDPSGREGDGAKLRFLLRGGGRRDGHDGPLGLGANLMVQAGQRQYDGGDNR